MAGNITQIFTKIVLRNDVISTWEQSNIKLEKGEPALEMDLDKRVAKIKIGDGLHTFNELPYSTATPDEIQEMINRSMANAGAISSISLTSGTENGTLKLTINDIPYDNIAVTGLGTAAFTDASAYATAEQGAKADKSMAFKGIVNELPVNASNGDTYKAGAEFTITSDVSYTGNEVKVSIDDVIVSSDGKWITMTSGRGGSSSTITTDNIVQGSNVIILNGGNAAQ